jgi:hypothetical protein
MVKLLPENVRAFCLALNALKQWIAKEQIAMDGFILGGNARKLCREAVNTCLVTGGPLGPDAQLHHPVRDGRPPILLSERGHAAIEGQESNAASDSVVRVLAPLKAKGQSWIGLKRGCLELLGKPVTAPSIKRVVKDRAFAKRCCEATGRSPEALLAWLDARETRRN